MKKLIATDYDGTLRQSDGISEENVSEILKWQAAGNYFGIVTGRNADFIRDAERFDFRPDFLIVYNGAYIVNANAEVIYSCAIDDRDFEELACLVSKIPNARDFDVYVPGKTRYQYYASYESTDDALKAAETVNRKMGDRVTAFVNGIHLNVAEKGCSKTDGVRIVQEYYGLSWDEVAVAGDDFNDMDMITAFDGWAMENGRTEVKQAANNVCSSIAALCRSLR